MRSERDRRTATVRIKQVAVVSYGLGQPPPSADGGIPILRATNIERGRINPAGMAYANLEDIPLDRAPLLRAGEVLVVRSGAYTGDSALVTTEWVGSAPGYDLRLTPRSVEPRFLAYQLLGRAVLDQISLASMRAAQPHLNAEDLGDVVIHLPPPRAQRAIADYLDVETARLDAMIARRRRQLDTLGEHRRSVIDSLVVPHALGGVADAQSDWPVVRLKRAAAFMTDGDWIESPFITTSGIRLIQVGNVGVGEYKEQGFRYISEETFLELDCAEVFPGDILISRLASPVGCACLAPELGTRMVTSVDVVILRPTPALDTQFGVLYFSSTYHLELADLLSRGTTMQRLARSQVADMPMPLPPVLVQEAVVREASQRLASGFAFAAALQRQVDLLVERRRALITAAVTGRIEIPGVAA